MVLANALHTVHFQVYFLQQKEQTTLHVTQNRSTYLFIQKTLILLVLSQWHTFSTSKQCAVNVTGVNRVYPSPHTHTKLCDSMSKAVVNKVQNKYVTLIQPCNYGSLASTIKLFCLVK